jgi:D-alanyl-D-alanine carboxypeptidase (penicillin-binding protein 5/6)
MISSLSRFRRALASIALLLCAELSCGTVFAQSSVPAPTIAARNWLLVDLTSGQTLAGDGAAARVEPASLTKLMTEYLTLQALRDKRLTLDQQVHVRPDLYKLVNQKEESVMFIPPGKSASVDDLLHGLIIQSGNDAALVLAEAVAGSESSFVDMMNNEAKVLGMTGTRYRNAAGLTDAEHYTTPQDLAILVQHLIADFPEYYKLYSQKEFTYNGIAQRNRNSLLWDDPSVDGVKTGHTEAAGFCLISSAHRALAGGGERRLLAVVLGANSSAARAEESLKLLNWGFQNFDVVKLYDANQAIASPEIWKGAQHNVKVGFLRPLFVTVPKGQTADLKSIFDHREPLLAPVAAGEPTGTLRVSIAGRPIGEYQVLALESVAQANWFGRTWDSIRLMFKK